jgi:hypothetical protein
MDKKWKLTIGIEPFYLTEDQKDFYLKAINNGVKYVQLDDKTFVGNSFQSLVHLDTLEENKKIEKGKWKCSYGKWHTEGWSCNCNLELVFDEKTGKYIEVPKKDLTKV